MKYKFKPSHIAPAYLFVVAVLYGGSKPPVTTNTPPVLMTHVKSATESGEAESLPLLPEATRSTDVVHGALSLQAEGIPLFHSVSNWTARGAYCDWLHITFPDGFEFPYGTNLLTGVTLMAYGELRESLAGSSVCSFVGLDDTQSTNQLTNQLTFSLVPDESTFAHGLTASNTYVFAWQNVCVDRSPTNRVDASIELFRNGAILTTTQPTNQPTNKLTNYIPAPLPPGFVGQGQDTNWLAATFSPTDYAAITNKGYARWLDEDYVGYNEENGHCRGTVTVPAMPPNGQPCYLVCGPHKMVVTEPGDYDFPVEVLTDIHIRTYPTAVPVSFSYDEGYYPDEDDYGALLMSPLHQSNNPNNLNNTNNQMPLLVSPSPTEINTRIIPSVHLSPSVIDFANAAGTHISIWCNIAGAAWRYYTTGDIEIRFNSRHDAEVLSAAGSYWATLDVVEDGHEECRGQVQLLPPGYLDNWDPDPDHTLTNCYEQESSTNTTTNGSTP